MVPPPKKLGRVTLNRLPNLFARRPEITRPLPAEIGPVEAGGGGWDTQNPLGVPFIILSFFDIDGRLFLIERCPYGQANNKAQSKKRVPVPLGDV